MSMCKTWNTEWSIKKNTLDAGARKEKQDVQTNTVVEQRKH